MSSDKYFLRNVIGEHMSALGKKNEKVVLVNADLAGTCRNAAFGRLFPKRAFNVGIAEQNLVSFAAGLACEGLLPYAFSMAPFLSMRACEQVRTDIAYGNRNVRLIGVYAGVSGGISGATHWAIEDVGIMTSIPGISVMEVSDPQIATRMLDYSLEHDGPIYIRCGVEPVVSLYDENVQIKAGGSNIVKAGNDGTILCSGVIVQYAVEATERIDHKNGKKIGVIDMYSIKPIDREAVMHAADTQNIVVAQDHNVTSGLCSIVSTILAEEGAKTRLKLLGIPDRFFPMAHAPYLYHEFGLDADGLERAMSELVG